MTLTCHICKKTGHKVEDCSELMEKSDKPYHHSNGHSNEDCYQQQHSGKSGARITRRAKLTPMTSAITREMVAATLSLTVKV